jgi:hypothetical protein
MEMMQNIQLLVPHCSVEVQRGWHWSWQNPIYDSIHTILNLKTEICSFQIVTVKHIDILTTHLSLITRFHEVYIVNILCQYAILAMNL